MAGGLVAGDTLLDHPPPNRAVLASCADRSGQQRQDLGGDPLWAATTVTTNRARRLGMARFGPKVIRTKARATRAIATP
jgi:hypothetical protein